MPYNIRGARNIFDLITAFFKVKSIAEIIIGVSLGFFLLTTYLGFVFGFFSMIRQKMYLQLFIITMILIYFSALSGFSSPGRYRLPMIPFYIIISAHGLHGLFRWLTSKTFDDNLVTK